MNQKINPGAIITNPGSTFHPDRPSFSTSKPVTDYSKCIKCGACWKYCPDMAYDVQKDNFFKVDLKKCKGCGICANECPVKCIKMEVLEQ
jgi:pyruvate ferredoxin oxidoreductase delta subunit|tara:strand:- start:478 stop:747 length:270 start_codon:yes stop_codon:yes gene_type:complete